MMRLSFSAKSSPACVKSTLIGCVFALLISYRMLVRHLDEERRSRLWTVVLTFTLKASPVANASSLPMGVWTMLFSLMNCGVPFASFILKSSMQAGRASPWPLFMLEENLRTVLKLWGFFIVCNTPTRYYYVC